MMDAGRELDALIALQIFRYTLDYEFADTLGAPCVRELRDQYDEWGMLPHYSTDMADAWLVVEAMTNDDSPINDKKYSFGLEYSSVVDWVADFTPRRNHPQAREYELFRVSAATPALAICRAALAACGVPS